MSKMRKFYRDIGLIKPVPEDHKVRLNIGCGDVILAGYENVDFYHDDPRVERMDLFKFPWKWDDESVDEVVAFAIWEHCPKPVQFMEEIVRVLKKGGRLKLYLPHVFSPAHYNLDHVVNFTSWTILSLDTELANWIWTAKKPPFKRISFGMRWITYPGKWTYTPVVDWLLSHYPHFCEKFLPFKPSCIFGEWEKQE